MLRAPLHLAALALLGCTGHLGALEVDEAPPPGLVDPVVIPDAVERSTAGVLRGPGALVAGGFHACLLGDGATVSCWGLGDFGQLGDGTHEDRGRPVEVVGLADVEQIALGLEHSCARLASGQVRCWGANPFGQLGDGSDRPSPVPVAVTGIDDAVDLQLGDFEACVMLAHGDIACWGGNLGGKPISADPDTSWRATPRIERQRQRGRGLAVTQSYRCTYGRDDVRCWGHAAFDACEGQGARDPSRCPIAGLTDVVAMDLDSGFGCAVIEDGAVRCWGSNSYGQTPTGGRPCYLDYPEPSCPRALIGIEPAIQVAVGTWHACALAADGEVTCWGTNNFGQIGTPIAGDEETRWRDSVGPTPVAGWHDVVEIVAGRGFTCARMQGGAVACIGDMAEGRRAAPFRVAHPAVH